MNAFFLHLPDGTPTKWSMCSECRGVAAPGNFDVSQKCCTCYDCGGILAKDERVPYAEGNVRSLYHRECELKRRAKREAEMLDRSELVPNYAGPVYFEGGHGSLGDSYFADIDELAEYLDDGPDEDRPEFVFCCEEFPFKAPNIERLIESACDEMDEDVAYERLDGIRELQAACEAFRKANESVTCWSVDYKHKVAVPPRKEGA